MGRAVASFFNFEIFFILKQTFPIELVSVFLCIIKWRRLLEKITFKKKNYTKALRPFLENINIIVWFSLLEFVIAIWKQVSCTKEHLVGSKWPKE